MIRQFIWLLFILKGAILLNAQTNKIAPFLIAGTGDDKLIITKDSSKNIVGFQVMGDGRIFAREIEITIKDFPDYVFDKNYPLIDLDQLRTYIETHHHLPNIISSKELEQNQHILNLGNQVTKQLEKIEELTLYILKLEQRIKALEQNSSK